MPLPITASFCVVLMAAYAAFFCLAYRNSTTALAMVVVGQSRPAQAGRGHWRVHLENFTNRRRRIFGHHRSCRTAVRLRPHRGDHHYRRFRLGDDAHQLVLQARAGECVQRAEWLVEQQHGRFSMASAGQCQTFASCRRISFGCCAIAYATNHLERRFGAYAKLRLRLVAEYRSTARYTLSKQVSHGSSGGSETPRRDPARPGDLAAGANKHAAAGAQPGDQVQQR